MGHKSKHRQQKIQKSSKQKKSGADHLIDASVTPTVYFNEEFNDKIPMYYLDSGIVITFGLIKLLEDMGLNQAQIKNAIMRGTNQTVNGGERIEGNPHNIDLPTADILFDLYKANRAGKVAFCVPPAVYKETMIDGRGNDNTKKQYTRKFIKENCFLVFPNEDLTNFARKTVGLQNILKHISANNGDLGLNPDMKRKKGSDGVRVLMDDNFEDRLILSQIAVITKQGKQSAQFISCSKSDELANSENVKKLYDESKRVEEQHISPLTPSSGHGDFATFIQINSKDFGKRSTSRKNSEAVGKNKVAEMIEEALKEFFGEDGGLEVATPTELGE